MEAATREPGQRSWSARRRALIALGVVAAAALSFLVGSGGDVGWLWSGSPDDAATDGVSADDLDADWEQADVVAVDEDRVRAEVDVAPHRDGGGRCVRVLLAGDVVGGRCASGSLNPWDDPGFELTRLDDYFGSLSEYAVRDGDGWVVALAGAVHPDVVRVTAHFGDARQYSFVTRNPGGWFVTVLPDDVADPAATDGRLVNAPVRLELFDAQGTRVASVDLSDGDPSGGGGAA